MSNLDELTIRTRNRRRELDTLAGEARSFLTRGKELQSEIAELDELISDLDKVTILLNSIGEERQQKTQDLIEQLVTRGLQTIFEDTLSFHIVQSVRGKTATVEFIVREVFPNGSVVETSVLDARGGGMAATIGFLLRITVMLLTRKNQENILVLDETFAMVSAEYVPALIDFIRELRDKTGIQIIMVTHQPEFAEGADKVYRFTTKNGKTQVSEDG